MNDKSALQRTSRDKYDPVLEISWTGTSPRGGDNITSLQSPITRLMNVLCKGASYSRGRKQILQHPTTASVQTEPDYLPDEEKNVLIKMYSNLRTQRRAIDCGPFRNSSDRNRLRGWSTPPPPNPPPQNDNQYSPTGGGGGMVGGGPVASVASPREKTHTLSSSWRIAKAIDSCLYPSLSRASISLSLPLSLANLDARLTSVLSALWTATHMCVSCVTTGFRFCSGWSVIELFAGACFTMAVVVSSLVSSDFFLQFIFSLDCFIFCCGSSSLFCVLLCCFLVS